MLILVQHLLNMDMPLDMSSYACQLGYVQVTFGYRVFLHSDELSRVVRSVVKAFVDTSLYNLTTPF